jgi:hypothetical protein
MHRTEPIQLPSLAGEDVAQFAGLHVGGIAVFAFVVLGLIVALLIRTARLRAVANVQGWAQQELRAVRGELAVSRMNDSAAEILVQEAQTRAALPAPPPEADDDPEDRRETIAMPAPTEPARTRDEGSGQVLEMVPSYSDDTTNEDEATHVAPRSARVLKEPKTYDPRPTELSQRRGRAAILVPTFRAPGEDSAC